MKAGALNFKNNTTTEEEEEEEEEVKEGKERDGVRGLSRGRDVIIRLFGGRTLRETTLTAKLGVVVLAKRRASTKPRRPNWPKARSSRKTTSSCSKRCSTRSREATAS